jgi:2-polyprenyl-3-methyl-5-hydroxy-6-metoxy-1,4-benzoquinol methylase
MTDQKYSCPACHSPNATQALSGCQDWRYECSGEWELRECERCKLIYTAPRPSPQEILQYYPDTYQPYKRLKSLRASPMGSIFSKILTAPYTLRHGALEWNMLPFGEGRLLEVGCGAGVFLQQAARIGWHCWGLDLSATAVASARENVPGATILEGTLESVHFDETFNIIKMAHVLEHVPDPIQTLDTTFKLLDDQGQLIIEVPNIKSFEAKLLGRYWKGLDMPRHLLHFSIPVITQMLEQRGFSVIKIRPRMCASSVSESLMMMTPSTVRKHLLGSKVAKVLHLLSIFPAALSYLLGNWAVIEITACKGSPFVQVPSQNNLSTTQTSDV